MYWSEAEAKEPVKAFGFIHFSRTSQPPKLTPRRKGIVLFEVLEGVGIAEEMGMVRARDDDAFVVRVGKVGMILLRKSLDEVLESVTEVLEGLS